MVRISINGSYTRTTRYVNTVDTSKDIGGGISCMTCQGCGDLCKNNGSDKEPGNRDSGQLVIRQEMKV